MSYCCKFCGESTEELMMNKGGGRRAKSLCKSCHNKQTIERGQKNREAYVNYLGGSCKYCSYARCLSALEFHHRDPSKKDPTFTSMRYWGLEKAKKELDKCDLVCANCHREVHAGLLGR